MSNTDNSSTEYLEPGVRVTVKRTTQWTDYTGRVWDFRIGIATASRLKSAGMDLMDPKSVKDWFGSSLSLIEFAGELMRPEWEKLGLNYEQFADLLIDSEESFLQVQQSIEFAFVDFFRRIGQKHHAVVAERAMESAARVMDQAVAIADQRTTRMARRLEQNSIDKLNAEFDKIEKMDVESLDKLGD
ncbi:MAG: hypothetical protein ACK506_16205 [Pirellula sp.]